MDPVVQTMIDNLQKNTGVSLDEWTSRVRKKAFPKFSEGVKWLKEEHGLGHGYANLIVTMAKQAATPDISEDEQIAAQYVGKEYFRPIYDQLHQVLVAFGNDVEVAPKKANVSYRRKKQFALLTPATKTRFEIGLNVKGQDDQGVLRAITKKNAMCSHQIDLSSVDDITPEVMDWLRKSYELAG
ncbi:MAG: DUF4287 domain-containing protein [Saprospiraceae bacterium]|nr:DUF4287 domain-containing protein [Saprospiraceae bacterium]